MKYQIRKAVVIGAGTMGAGIAAHLANIGVHVTLLDIIPGELTTDEEKNGLSLKRKSTKDLVSMLRFLMQMELELRILKNGRTDCALL